MGGVAKITISPKSSHFGTTISLKWRLASPCAALGSHLDRLFGGPKSDPGKVENKVMRPHGFHAAIRPVAPHEGTVADKKGFENR